MLKENTYGSHERFDIEYGCSFCKHVKNSIFKEPCWSCYIDGADHKPTGYEPKLCSTNTTD